MRVLDVEVVIGGEEGWLGGNKWRLERAMFVLSVHQLLYLLECVEKKCKGRLLQETRATTLVST